MAAFTVEQHSWVVVTEIVWPANIYIGLFPEQARCPLHHFPCQPRTPTLGLAGPFLFLQSCLQTSPQAGASLLKSSEQSLAEWICRMLNSFLNAFSLKLQNGKTTAWKNFKVIQRSLKRKTNKQKNPTTNSIYFWLKQKFLIFHYTKNSFSSVEKPIDPFSE